MELGGREKMRFFERLISALERFLAWGRDPAFIGAAVPKKEKSANRLTRRALKLWASIVT